MTLLTIVQDVADEIGLPRPSAVLSSTDQTTRQLLALANREGRQLAQRYKWQALTKEGSFTTVATESQGALTTIAADFSRFLNDTMYDRTRTWRIVGPLSAQQWQRQKGTAAGTFLDTFRIRGGEILFWPVPAAGRNVFFEYVSKNWCQSSAAAPQDEWAADDDTGILDEDLVALGVKWRFLKAKGLDYGEEFRDYETRLYDARARDGAKPVLDISGSALAERPGVGLADGSWDP